MYKYFFSLFFAISFYFSNSLFSQTGNHFVKNFLPKDYDAAANNSGITQNKSGLIFVANNNGVMIYDGIKWESYNRIGEPKIMSIATAFNNEVVVGTEDGDIAVISQKKNGKYFYKSLLEGQTEEQKPKEIIRQILTIDSCTYFLSSDKLIEYSKRGLKFYNPSSSFHTRAIVIGKHLFVLEKGKQLSVLINGKLKAVEGSQWLASEVFFYNYPINKNKYALGIRNLGTYLVYYDSLRPTQIKFVHKPSSCDAEIISAVANNGTLLRNGNFIVTTNYKGAFELDTNLNIVRKYNIKNGVYDNNIKFAYEDLNGNLWLALYYGVSFVETNSRLFQYTRDDNIAGTVQSAVYFKNKLFVGTDKGLQFYDTIDEKFKLFQDFDKQIWHLAYSFDNLFIGSDNGLFVYDDKEFKQLTENRTFFIRPDKFQKNILYIGTEEGLETYWITNHSVAHVTTYTVGSEVKSIAQDSSKKVYFVSGEHKIYFLDYNHSNIIHEISEANGLPQQEFETYLFPYNNRLLLGTDTGFYTIVQNKSGQLQCLKDPEFYSRTKRSQIFRACQFGYGLISHQKYLNLETRKQIDKISLLEADTNNNYRGIKSLNHLMDVSPNSISNDTSRKLVFICSNEGLFILNNELQNRRKNYTLLIHSFISNVDTLMEFIDSAALKSIGKISIPYFKNNLKLTLGFTSYETNAIEFCYRLIGRDKNFSEWEKENKINFTDLREGTYTLVIRARTDLEQQVHELVIPFEINPPWYRSILAYVVYVILFISFIYLVVKLNSKRLLELNRKLEKTIEERTSTISHQKEEIEHKQKEILDSINYAQRIQRALLASDKLLNANMPEHFVFFRPKDVVSGDFYWASVLANNRFALVTADSTGHGVPGAIMSMLNISCLKESVESEKLTSPKDILNHTRKKVIETLANDGSAEGGKDGMDCSLLCLDFKHNTFSYAAANNPVWIIRQKDNDTKEFIELSPDKMPVGKHDRDQISFTEHEIELKPGDLVYTLTDGLPDQFGGPKGKKFMYKQLKELLMRISALSMTEQKESIIVALDEWMGNNEQVDDICVIGLRV